MDTQLLSFRADARIIGLIGGMRVLVGTREIPDWPQGAVGIALGMNPFKIFSPDINWTRNPNGEDKRRVILTGSPLFRDWQHHLHAQNLLVKETIKGPMNNYLFISHLFADGYSLMKHISWSSYFMDRVATFLQSPEVIQDLLRSDYNHQEHVIHD